MAALDLSRDRDVKISRVAYLYSLFVLPERAEDQRASSWYLNHLALTISHFLHDPLSLCVPDPL